MIFPQFLIQLCNALRAHDYTLKLYQQQRHDDARDCRQHDRPEIVANEIEINFPFLNWLKIRD